MRLEEVWSFEELVALGSLLEFEEFLVLESLEELAKWKRRSQFLFLGSCFQQLLNNFTLAERFFLVSQEFQVERNEGITLSFCFHIPVESDNKLVEKWFFEEIKLKN